MTRVRYAFSNGLLVSKPMIAGLDLIKVSINPTNFSYTITSANSGNVLAQSTEYTSLSAVKMAAKTCSKVLGVAFSDEVRVGSKYDSKLNPDGN